MVEIIDLSHHNVVTSFHEIQASGVPAIFLKASEGTSMKDPKYDDFVSRALSIGLMVGSYHFSNQDDPIRQADHFLSLAHKDTVLALDCETTMSVKDAEAFCSYVHEKTKVWPFFYSYQAWLRAKLRAKSKTLSNCPAWLARYGNFTPTTGATWPNWTLWQFTDGVVGPTPHVCPGVIGHVDRSRFAGSQAELETLWKEHIWPVT